MSRPVEADREADIEVDEDEQICSPYHNTPTQTRQDHYLISSSKLKPFQLLNKSASVFIVMVWRAYLVILVNFYISFSVSFYRTRHGASHESYQIAHEVAGRIAKGSMRYGPNTFACLRVF